MPQLSVHELLAEMEAMVEDLREELAQNLDFTGLEQVITARLNELGAELVKQVVEPLLIDAGYVERLKGTAVRVLAWGSVPAGGPLRDAARRYACPPSGSAEAAAGAAGAALSATETSTQQPVNTRRAGGGCCCPAEARTIEPPPAAPPVRSQQSIVGGHRRTPTPAKSSGSAALGPPPRSPARPVTGCIRADKTPTETPSPGAWSQLTRVLPVQAASLSCKSLI